MKLNLLDRYVLSQVLITCLGCIFIFMIVWIMPEILLKTVQRTINGTYTIETAISILVYEMPKVLNIALPVGMLLGTILTFDKLSKDSEVTIFRSSGIPFFRIIASVIVVGAAVTAFIIIKKNRRPGYVIPIDQIDAEDLDSYRAFYKNK